jgi:hypothetical protein
MYNPRRFADKQIATVFRNPSNLEEFLCGYWVLPPFC